MHSPAVFVPLQLKLHIYPCATQNFPTQENNDPLNKELCTGMPISRNLTATSIILLWQQETYVNAPNTK
jgi:hypothetical protein